MQVSQAANEMQQEGEAGIVHRWTKGRFSGGSGFLSDRRGVSCPQGGGVPIQYGYQMTHIVGC